MLGARIYLHHYFNKHVCLCVHPCVRLSEASIFFSLKLPWNHSLTPGVDPQGWPWVALGHAAPPEELARAWRALSSIFNKTMDLKRFGMKSPGVTRDPNRAKIEGVDSEWSYLDKQTDVGKGTRTCSEGNCQRYEKIFTHCILFFTFLAWS